MPDIALRINKDMLVLSAPVEGALARLGVDAENDMEYMLVNEPEAIRDALNLEQAVGAQCLVLPTKNLTQARLAAHGMDGHARALADAAQSIVKGLKPQHILAEIGPCGLPLDPSSASSLDEHCEQYAQAVGLFGADGVDAIFFNGFTRLEDMACALRASADAGLPVFASVTLNDEGTLARGATLEDAAACALEEGAAAFGFESACGPDGIAGMAKRAKLAAKLPIIVQFRIAKVDQKAYEPTSENPYYCPDTMVAASAKAYAAGAQFVRATGAATASYTGALMATVTGLDVIQ